MEILLFVVVVIALNAQPSEGQYYCNGRAAITAQWGGCNGTEAVCSDLMQAITSTWNWWSGVNNTNESSLGVAAHNFFTTDAYGEMLSFTNNNTAYSNVCTKIAKIVAQLLIWNKTKNANVILGNATYSVSAREELFNTVVPNWGYTIGQYIACGPTCTNYTSTTSSTTTTTTTPSKTTTSAETTTAATTTYPTTTIITASTTNACCDVSAVTLNSQYAPAAVVVDTDNCTFITLDCANSVLSSSSLLYATPNGGCTVSHSPSTYANDTLYCSNGQWVSQSCSSGVIIAVVYCTSG